MKWIAVLISTITLTACLLCGCKGMVRVKESEVAAIKVSESSLIDDGYHVIDLGRMREGEVVVKKIRLQNIDSQPLVITAINAGCDCLNFEFSRRPVQYNDTMDVELRFESRGLGGEIVRDVEVMTSFRSQKTLWFQVVAIVE